MAKRHNDTYILGMYAHRPTGLVCIATRTFEGIEPWHGGIDAWAREADAAGEISWHVHEAKVGCWRDKNGDRITFAACLADGKTSAGQAEKDFSKSARRNVGRFRQVPS